MYQSCGIKYWPAESTGDLYIQRRDGSVIRTVNGDGMQTFQDEVDAERRAISTYIVNRSDGTIT